MDWSVWGAPIGVAVVGAISAVVIALITRFSAKADAIKKYTEALENREERVDELQHQADELRAERDELRATVASLRAELAQVREGGGAKRDSVV